jgi:hypothetical protein
MKRRPLAIGRWSNGKIEPWARVDVEAMATWKDGDLIEMFPYNSRRSDQNRLLHGILGIAVDNSDGWTVESLKFRLKMQGGWTNGATLRQDGNVYVEVRSTADFSEHEMNIFIDEAKDFILSDVIPGMDLDALIDEAKTRSAARKPKS